MEELSMMKKTDVGVLHAMALALVALVAMAFAQSAIADSGMDAGTILLYPTALKTGVNVLADKTWCVPDAKHAPHAVATVGRGGPRDAAATARTLENTCPEFAYWNTSVGGIRTGRVYFGGAWTKIESAKLLYWWHGQDADNGKETGARVYCNSGCLPSLEPYFDDDTKQRISGDPNKWRLIARTFTLSAKLRNETMTASYGFYRAPGKATFAEPFLIDVTDAPQTLEIELKGVKPVKRLLVIRTDTRDPAWRKEFATPVTDFSQTLPDNIRAFYGMNASPVSGYALVVTYADGTEDRVACPAEGLF